MSDTQRLTNLLTYTTFHIGVYITLIAALISSSLIFADSNINIYLLRFSSACILMAGIFGGIIGSNISNFNTYEEMKNSKLKIFNTLPVPNLERCIHLEHFFFWLGTLPIVIIFIVCGADALRIIT